MILATYILRSYHRIGYKFAQARPLRYFCTDESRWGLKTLTGRVLTLRGVKPVALWQWPRRGVLALWSSRATNRSTLVLQLLSDLSPRIWKLNP